MGDRIRITILEDGTIKTETDRVSLPNHTNAEGFLRQIAQIAGGAVERRHKHGAILHHHGHGQHLHAHDEQHH